MKLNEDLAKNPQMIYLHIHYTEGTQTTPNEALLKSLVGPFYLLLYLLTVLACEFQYHSYPVVVGYKQVSSRADCKYVNGANYRPGNVYI